MEGGEDDYVEVRCCRERRIGCSSSGGTSFFVFQTVSTCRAVTRFNAPWGCSGTTILMRFARLSVTRWEKGEGVSKM